MNDANTENRNLMPMVTASVTILTGAMVTILIYVIQQVTGHSLPEEVNDAILVLVEAGSAFAVQRITQP